MNQAQADTMHLIRAARKFSIASAILARAASQMIKDFSYAARQTVDLMRVFERIDRGNFDTREQTP